MTVKKELSDNEKKIIDKFLLDRALQIYNADTGLQECLKGYWDEEQANNISSGSKSANVVRVTLYADPTPTDFGGSIDNVGAHAWISMENISSGYQRMGALDFYGGYGITIGTFGTQPHNGIYYNLEGVRVNYHNYYGNRYSLTVDIPASKLNTLNSYLTNEYYDDYNSVTKNCAFFASVMWGKVGTYVNPGLIPTPKTLAENIQERSGYSYNRSVPYFSTIYYGSSANIAGTGDYII